MMKKIRSKMLNVALLFFLIAVDILFLSWTPAYSYQWYFATEFKNTHYFIDTETVLTGRASVTFSVMSRNKKTGQIKFIKKCTINCGDSIIAIREVSMQGLFGGFDKISYEYNLMWSDIIPKSATESIEKMVCSGGRPRQELKEYLSEPHIQGLEEPCSYLFRKKR